MWFIMGIAVLFGSTMLVIFAAMIQLDHPGARVRLHSLFFQALRSPPISRGEQIAPILDAIQVPFWFSRLADSQKVLQAGIPQSRNHFQSVWWLISWLSLFLGLLTGFVISANRIGILIGFLVFIAGIAGPHFYLRHRIQYRRRAFQRALPDFLEMLTFTVEAGLGLTAAIKRVSAQSSDILQAEFNLAMLQIGLGSSQREALVGITLRVPSEDVKHFIEAIMLAERLGTSLTRTLRIQTQLLRTRRRQRAKIQAQTAPIRIIPALVFFFLPSLLLIYLAPPIISFLLNR